MTIQEFITERAAGAAKIAKEARAKGGLSLLTAEHFEAKAPSYAAALKLVSSGEPQGEVIETLKMLERTASVNAMQAGSMTMFQQQTGKQEVYGEVLLQMEFGGSVSARAKRDDEVVKEFEITCPKDVMVRFERFLHHVQHCAGVGHSTTVGMNIDGDGPDYFYVKPDPQAPEEEPTAQKREVEVA